MKRMVFQNVYVLVDSWTLDIMPANMYNAKIKVSVMKHYRVDNQIERFR